MAYRDPVTGKFTKGQSRDHAGPEPFDPREPASDISWWQAGLLACAIALIVVAVLIARNP